MPVIVGEELDDELEELDDELDEGIPHASDCIGGREKITIVTVCKINN